MIKKPARRQASCTAVDAFADCIEVDVSELIATVRREEPGCYERASFRLFRTRRVSYQVNTDRISGFAVAIQTSDLNWRTADIIKCAPGWISQPSAVYFFCKLGRVLHIVTR